MKNKAVAIGIIAILIIAGGMFAVNAGNDNNGNGAPNGKHYNLNLLGKSWEKGNPTDENIDDPNYNPVIKDDNGHRIFVRLEGRTKIMLQEGPFDVIDADGTDGKAVFQLPKPYDEEDTNFAEPAYQVWIRVLSPRGSASMYTTLFDGTSWLVSQEVVTLQGKTGKKTFTDVTRELTTIYVDIDGDGNPERIGLFDDDYQNWLWAWDYNNLNLRHVQLRFYPVEYT